MEAGLEALVTAGENATVAERAADGGKPFTAKPGAGRELGMEATLDTFVAM